jgi:hypothetical protein
MQLAASACKICCRVFSGLLSAVQSRQFFESTLQEQLFELKNEKNHLKI